MSTVPTERPALPRVALDPEVERVARFLEERAPVSIDPALRRQVAFAVVEESRLAGFDPLFVLALMEVESDFLPEAVSNRQARGLLQLRDITVREIIKHEELPAHAANEADAVVDVRLGIRYLARMMDRFRTTDRALVAWNAGPGALRRALAETGEVPERWLGFPKAVMREHRKLQRRYAEKTELASAVRPE